MGFPNQIFHYHNVFVGNNVYISKKCVFLCTIGKIHIKDNAMIGEKTSLIAGNHNINETGKFLNQSLTKLPMHDKGITIGEDTIMTLNVTVLDGVTIGRGAVIGAGAVVRTSVPPYALVAGNPAMIIGFRYSPAQVVAHEEKLYEEGDRIPLEELQKNFKKYYLQRLGKIASVLRT